MDGILESQFQRVEVALANLVDSIAKYNPNPLHANDLVTADAELSQGLEQLTTHQANYARILTLRATSAALDNHIRETLLTLTSIRKDLLATPSTTPPPHCNPVPYADLLDYARKISKFTLPPGYRDPGLNGERHPAMIGASKDASSSTQTPGESSPTRTSHDHVPADAATDAAPALPAAEGVPTSQSTIQINNNNWADYLNPHNNMTWTPWPSEETIRRGALASIQILLNQGIDPDTFDPEKGAELEAERKRVTEEEDRLREEERNRIEVEQKIRMEKRIGTNQVERSGEQPKVFRLETFDDDDDDDDDDD